MDQLKIANDLLDLIKEDHSDSLEEVIGIDILDYLAILGVKFTDGSN